MAKKSQKMSRAVEWPAPPSTRPKGKPPIPPPVPNKTQEAESEDALLVHMHEILLEMRNRIEVLEMAMVEQAKRQQAIESDGR